MAISWFGLTPKEFMNLAPVEFIKAIDEKSKFIDNAEKAHFERVKILAEAIRTETFYLVNLQAKRKVSHPKKLMQFSWDKNKVVAKTPSEMKNLFKSIARVNKKKRNKNKK